MEVLIVLRRALGIDHRVFSLSEKFRTLFLRSTCSQMSRLTMLATGDMVATFRRSQSPEALFET